jgi:hypothetical protein
LDILNHLRTILDRAGAAIATAAGTFSKRANFPFGQNPQEVASRHIANGKSRDIPEKVFAVMAAFQPYPGGNDTLWGLNALCNSKKHHILVPHVVGVTLLNHTVKISGGFRGPIPPVWDHMKNEMVIGHTSPGTDLDFQFDLRCTIKIGNIERIGGKDAIPLLHQMTNMVQDIVMAIEAEALRIGIPL